MLEHESRGQVEVSFIVLMKRKIQIGCHSAANHQEQISQSV
jgi:hypothetical protein